MSIVHPSKEQVVNCEEVEKAAERVECTVDQLYLYCDDDADIKDMRSDVSLLATSIPVLFRALEKACDDEDLTPSGQVILMEGCISQAEAEIEKERQNAG